MSNKKAPQKDKHFPQGIAPQKVKELAASAFGFIPKHVVEEEQAGLTMIEQLKLAAKREQPKLGRPPIFKEFQFNFKPMSLPNPSVKMAKQFALQGESMFTSTKPQGAQIKNDVVFTEEELDYMVSEPCLRYQGTYKLEQRAAELSLLFNKKITTKQLRELYHGRGITLQKVKKRIGGRNPKHEEAQIEDIEHLKEKIARCLSMGRLILYMDCASFSGEQIESNSRVWSSSKEPMKLKYGTSGDEYVTAIAAATETTGELHYSTLKGRGFRKEDVVAFFRILKKFYGKTPLAIFMDNQSSFKANIVKYAATDLDIVLLYNIPARPDFNGVEGIWFHVKSYYGLEKKKYLMAGKHWDNEQLATNAILSVTPDTVKSCILRGIERLMDGKPISVQEGERIADEMNDFCAQFGNVFLDSAERQENPNLAQSFIQPQVSNQMNDEYMEPFSDNQDAEDLEGRDNQIDSSARPKRQCVLKRLSAESKK